VNKALLEAGEDELDLQRVPIRDLIILADYKERQAVHILFLTATMVILFLCMNDSFDFPQLFVLSQKKNAAAVQPSLTNER